MKQRNLFTLLFLCFAYFNVSAQNTSGEIHYKETVKIEIDIPEDMKEHMKGQLPTEQSSMRTLLFTENESLWKNMDEDEEAEIEHEHNEGNVQMKVVIMRPDNQMYKDLAGGRKVAKQDFMGKKFLIKDELKKYEWKMTGEQKQVLDFMCMKAETMQEDRKIEVWFSPQIPVSVGPSNLGQLPGAILEVSIDEGSQTITAVKTNFRQLEEGEIEEPTKGKLVTQEEMDKIMDEKMKEMEEQMGGNASWKIRTN